MNFNSFGYRDAQKQILEDFRICLNLCVQQPVIEVDPQMYA